MCSCRVRTIEAVEQPREIFGVDLVAGIFDGDSLGALVLAVALEDRFRVKLTGVEAASVSSVEELVGVVERAVREAGVGGASRDADGGEGP